MYLISLTESRKTFLLLVVILFIKAFISALLIPLTGIGLSPDEAQYWTWSQNLALSYYSKPPFIAWQIFVTTKIFGNTVFGVRFGAIILNFLLSLSIWRVARIALFSPQIAFWSALVFAFSPFGIFFAFPATSDLGALLFFTLAIGEFAKGAVKDQPPRYFLCGLWIFFGALYKWIAFAFWPFALLFAIRYKSLRDKKILLGIAISLLALLPALLWNIDHDFATFKHVFFTFFNRSHPARAKTGNFLDFLFSQIGLIFPLFFFFMAIGAAAAYKTRKTVLAFLAAFPTAVLIYLLLACFKKIQPNWALYLYPPGFVLAAWWGYKKAHIWLPIGLYTSLAFCIFALSIPAIQSHSLLPFLPYKINPFRQTLGWENIKGALQQSGYNPQNDFLFSDKYQIASILSFYGPWQKRAYFFNLGNSRKNQFSYWPGMNPREIGKTGFFVVAENTTNLETALPWYITHYTAQLSPYFSSIEVAHVAPLFLANNKPSKFALIFRCTQYNGQEPKTPEKY